MNTLDQNLKILDKIMDDYKLDNNTGWEYKV